ncbi:hypothetical protein EXW50_06515 [Bacillus mycoides]|uniref:DUF1664 domain-containing protein n=1 Tax=Bacillus mycoides TaxID=1405 RepID=UPI001C021FE5|nr:DUF1664 domain-containing protein [Bacillus mycoides]QWG55064.1 hypothetical protein EXW26_06520 [Bacillus mycoides]QWG72119.1 hypothetical protein EXW63_07870 [Bacillus mycoides]QWH22067.1 hypothetical protein EXW50_06515 [Bacillus mycoides]
MKERITKKDLGYWILILIGVIVTILTIKLADNATAVDYIGFAGTITSILLAVVALMYSFYQNNAYESTTQQLESSSQKIKKAVKELNQVSELKEIVTEIQNESSSIAMSIKGLHETVGTVESAIHSVSSNLEDTKQNLFKNFNLKSGNNNVKNDFTNIKQLVEGLNMSSFILLYICYAMHEKNIKVDLDKFNRFYINKIFSDNKDLNGLTKVILGMLFMFSQFGFFGMDYDSHIEITQFNEAIGNEVINRRDQILESDNEKYEKYKKSIKDIDTFVSENINQ